MALLGYGDAGSAVLSCSVSRGVIDRPARMRRSLGQVDEELDVAFGAFDR